MPLGSRISGRAISSNAVRALLDVPGGTLLMLPRRLIDEAFRPAIWHENKAGNVTSYPYSCALRAGASYNNLLVDGKRRLTPREMLRLQGFPDSFKIVNETQTRKHAGNAVPVPIVRAVLGRLLESLAEPRRPIVSAPELLAA
jgi:DNA (cytosine-5)-methyltransferase 1